MMGRPWFVLLRRLVEVKDYALVVKLTSWPAPLQGGNQLLKLVCSLVSMQFSGAFLEAFPQGCSCVREQCLEQWSDSALSYPPNN